MVMTNTDDSSTTLTNNEEQTASSISMDTVSSWNFWSFAWVRWFYVSCFAKVNVGEAAETNQPPTVNKLASLKLAYGDCCAINSEALLEFFRSPTYAMGRCNFSTIRIIVAVCGSRLAIASFMHLLVSSAWILAIMHCLRMVMHATNSSWEARWALIEIADDGDGVTTVKGHNSTDDLRAQMSRDGQVIVWNTVGYVVILTAMVGLRSATNAVILRAAIQLRNACVGAIYQTVVNGSVQSRIASHQIMTLCGEDGNAIMDLVLKGTFIVSLSAAILIGIFVGVITLDATVFLALIGISFILLLATTMAMFSRAFYRKVQWFMNQKLGVVEDYFDSLALHDRLKIVDIFKKRFAASVSGQFWALFRAESLRPSFSGGITVYFLLACCVVFSSHRAYDDNTGSLLALMYLFVSMFHFLVHEWSESYMALMKGQLVMDKIQSMVKSTTRPALPNKSSTNQNRFAIQNATFLWDQLPKSTPNYTTDAPTATAEPDNLRLSIDSFCVPNIASCFGVTGLSDSGKESFVYALLGQMPHRSGEFYSTGLVAYYPERPYILEGGTLRDNICWSSVGAFDEAHYRACISLVHLQLNTGFDLEPLESSHLDQGWLQKISLARALYNQKQEIVLLHNPLSGLDSSTEISDIFDDVVRQLTRMGKSVVVVSKDDNILRHCSDVYVLNKGELSSPVAYDVYSKSEANSEIKNEYNQGRLNTRNSTNVQNLQTAINLSSEDLVCNLPKDHNQLPTIFNRKQTFYFVMLNVGNVFMHAGLPFFEIVYMHIYPPTISGLIFGLIIAIVLLVGSSLVKHYGHRIGRRFVKTTQKDIFEKLQNSSMANSSQSQFVFVMNLLLEGNFKAFQTRTASIYACMSIGMTCLLTMGYDSFITGVVVILVLQFVGVYFIFRNTVTAAGHLDIERRLRLYQHVHNDVINRAVLQSTDEVLQARNKIFKLIEDHASVVYLQKSIVFFSQFVFEFAHCLLLPFIFFLMHMDPYLHDYMYLVTLYMINLVTITFHGLLDIRFTKIAVDQQLIYSRKFVNSK